MKLKNKKAILLSLVLFFATLSVPFISTQKALAVPIPDGCPGSANPVQPPPPQCAQIPIGCPGSSQQGPVAEPPDNCPYGEDLESDCDTLDYEHCGIVRYITIFTNILTVVVGLVIVIMIVLGGIQYTASQDNPQATAAAKGKITNAILALVFFIFARAVLEYFIPGGIF